MNDSDAIEMSLTNRMQMKDFFETQLRHSSPTLQLQIIHRISLGIFVIES